MVFIKRAAFAALFIYIKLVISLMNRFTIITSLTAILFFFSCGDNSSSTVVVTIDGNKLRSNEFFSSISQTEYYKLKTPIRREKILEFATIRLAAQEAKRENINLDQEALYSLATKKNQLFINLLIKEVINPELLADSVAYEIHELLKTERFVREIVIFHKFSLGHVAERTPVEAQKLANIALKRLRLKNINFDEAVSIYTTMPSLKLRNGEVGYLPYGEYPKNYNDAIWSAQEDTIIGPIKTKYGYHIVEVGAIKEITTTNTVETVEKAISNGKYGVFSEKMDQFVKDLRGSYNCNLDTLAVIDLWQQIEAGSDYKEMIFNDLSDIAYDRPIATCDGEELSLNWFVDQGNRHGQINVAVVHAPIALIKNLMDIMNRFLTVRWVSDNDNINKKHLHEKVRAIETILLKEAYVQKELEITPQLSESVLFNRLLLNHEIVVNEKFIDNN